jgi:predicted RNA-binding Zn-ribbon protein involved in translation (DUF1610 family)
MKIIKKGIPKDEIKSQWGCPKCGSIIESTASDGTVICDQRDGDYVVFVCPICECDVVVDLSRFKG